MTSFSLFLSYILADIDVMDTDDDDGDDAPTVYVSGKPIPLGEVNAELIEQMTPQEKDTYIHIYQEHYSHMYD